MSLRTRLLAVLLALAALGLVALAAITYAEQRSFLLDRVDEQARAALPIVGHEVEPQFDPDGDPGPGGGEPSAVNLPPGTYGEHRDAAGNTVARVTLTYGQTTTTRPELPADMPTGRIITVGSSGDWGSR